MYLDKPLRDHNLLQAVARTNRPFPALNKLTGIVVDYFGVFADMQKALNFDESIIEESLIDWDRLRSSVAGEVARCMEQFEGITIEDTRDCLLAALRRLKDPDAGKVFEQNFKSLERLWRRWLPTQLCTRTATITTGCVASTSHTAVASAASTATYGELSAKTRRLIEENTTFIRTAEALPVFKIDKDYVTKVDQLRRPTKQPRSKPPSQQSSPRETPASYTDSSGNECKRSRTAKTRPMKRPPSNSASSKRS